MILLFILLFSVKAEAGVFSNKCEGGFSEYSQELSSQLRSKDTAVQKNILPFFLHYGADDKLIRESLQYVLRTSSSEDIRLKAVNILEFHHQRAKKRQSKRSIFDVLREVMKKDSSKKIQMDLIDFFSRFIYSRDVAGDFINIIERDAPSLREPAVEGLKKILSFYLEKWNDTLTAVKENLGRNAAGIDEKPSKTIYDSERMMAYYSSSWSMESRISKSLLKILRNRQSEVKSKTVIFARKMNIAKAPYGIPVRMEVFELLKIIYHINLLKMEVMDVLRTAVPYLERDDDIWRDMFNTKYKAERMNQEIRGQLMYIVKFEPEINISLVRKSFDFLLDVFKKNSDDTDRDKMFGFLQDVSSSQSVLPLIRQKALKALEDFPLS